MKTVTCDRCGATEEDEEFSSAKMPVSGKLVHLCLECDELWDKSLRQWWKEVDQKMEGWLNQSTRSGE